MKKTFCFISMAAFALGSFAAHTVFTPTSGTVEKCEYGTSVLENKLSEVEDDSVYMTVDELPTFPGGDMACAEWLRAHLKYPKQCQKERIEGRVIVRFVVEKKWTYIQCEGYQKSTSRTGKSSSSNSQADAQVDTRKEGGANCPLQP